MDWSISPKFDIRGCINDSFLLITFLTVVHTAYVTVAFCQIVLIKIYLSIYLSISVLSELKTNIYDNSPTTATEKLLVLFRR